jgi:cytochrome b pre-mRNA-processing protein 3
MRSLFNRWRTPRNEVLPLYTALIAEARRPAWYVEGQVADTLDGRFAVLASVVALAILRLEDGDEEAVRGSVALTESFISDMDAQMREEGFGDPSVGKQVRSMVGALASRVDRGDQFLAGRLDLDDIAGRVEADMEQFLVDDARVAESELVRVLRQVIPVVRVELSDEGRPAEGLADRRLIVDADLDRLRQLVVEDEAAMLVHADTGRKQCCPQQHGA